MAMGTRRKRQRQHDLWVSTTDLPRSAAHPFYRRMNALLDEDTTGGVELVVFPDTFAQYERVLKSDQPLMISGVLEKAEGAVKVIAEQIKPAEELVRLVKKVTLKMDPTMEAKLALVHQWAEKNPGEIPLVLRLQLPDLSKAVDLELKETVKPTLEALDGLNRLVYRWR